MCGIFGQWNRDGSPVDLARVERATTAIRHRGPDDEGYLLVNTRSGALVLCGGSDTNPELALPHIESFRGQSFDLVLAFRRLSILDLSPAGHQPMRSADGARWITFNGEIYNFVELRDELRLLGHEFRSDSDTEVILAAYAQWGEAAIERLRGMFAFALWDSPQRRLLLARDRFGIKPLFVHQRDTSILWGSELKTFGPATGSPYEACNQAVAAFVSAGRMPNAPRGETFFRGISSLPAAHRAVYTVEHATTERYWQIPEPAVTTRSAAETVEEYRRIFFEAVRIHLRSDVPVGTCLSGGLDSSSIVAAVTEMRRRDGGDPIRSFSAVYSDEGPWNERPLIERVVSRTGARPHYVEPESGGLFAELSKLVWHQEEPFATTSMYAQWCVMRESRRNGVTVLLDGQGADELLGGYHSFYADHLRATLTSRGLFAAWSEARAGARVAGSHVEKSFLKEVARTMGFGAGRQARTLQRWNDRAALREPAADVATTTPERDFASILRRAAEEDPMPHLLRFEDRNSMAFSVEARVPFLDHRLFEFVSREADPFRIRAGWTKWIHRAAFDEQLPSEIAWRRDKVGYLTPEHRWLSERSGEIADRFGAGQPVDRLLVTSDIRKRLADPSFIVQNGSLVWRWLCVAVWSEVFLA